MFDTYLITYLLTYLLIYFRPAATVVRRDVWKDLYAIYRASASNACRARYCFRGAVSALEALCDYALYKSTFTLQSTFTFTLPFCPSVRLSLCLLCLKRMDTSIRSSHFLTVWYVHHSTFLSPTAVITRGTSSAGAWGTGWENFANGPLSRKRYETIIIISIKAICNAHKVNHG